MICGLQVLIRATVGKRDSCFGWERRWFRSRREGGVGTVLQVDRDLCDHQGRVVSCVVSWAHRL